MKRKIKKCLRFFFLKTKILLVFLRISVGGTLPFLISINESFQKSLRNPGLSNFVTYLKA